MKRIFFFLAICYFVLCFLGGNSLLQALSYSMPSLPINFDLLQKVTQHAELKTKLAAYI